LRASLFSCQAVLSNEGGVRVGDAGHGQMFCPKRLPAEVRFGSDIEPTLGQKKAEPFGYAQGRLWGTVRDIDTWATSLTRFVPPVSHRPSTQVEPSRMAAGLLGWGSREDS